MMEVKKEKFAVLEKAIRDCLDDVTNVNGLKIAVPPHCFERNEIEHAAAMALMSLIGDWVRPQGLIFMAMGSDGNTRSF